MGESIEKAISKSVRIGELEDQVNAHRDAAVSWKTEAHRLESTLTAAQARIEELEATGNLKWDAAVDYSEAAKSDLRARIEELEVLLASSRSAHSHTAGILMEQDARAEELERMVVWSVLRCFGYELKCYGTGGRHLHWWDEDGTGREMDCDGTPASILAAVAKAMSK